MSSRCDIVIPTRNRPEALRRCLTGLALQTERDIRVIIVDDCSDDPTASRAVRDEEQFAQLDIEVVELPRQGGPAAARNTGVESVTSEFVIFLDDDMFADPAFVAAHLGTVTAEPSQPGGIPVSFGPFIEPPDWEPTPWNLWEARQAHKEMNAMLDGEYEPTWRQFHTGNNCLPTSVFRAVGGFDESFKRSEDDEFGLRLDQHGCEFVFQPKAIGLHYSNRSLEAWISIPRSYAFFDVQIDRMYPEFGYLPNKQSELARRRWPLRFVRRFVTGPRRTVIVTKLAVAVTQVLYRIGLRELAMAPLSVAYDLTYVESMRVVLLDQSVAD